MSRGNQSCLQKLRALQNLAIPEFERALGQEALRRTQRFIAGIRAYHRSNVCRDVPSAPVIWQNGTTRLRDYSPKNTGAPIVLVIPSLINRFDILDLDYAPSFLRFLASQELRPLVMDWDAPGESEKNFSLNDYVTKKLVPVLDFINTMLETKKQEPGKKYRSAEAHTPHPHLRCHIIGYCMGGLLALALAALRPQQTKTLTLIATPWDFHKPDESTGPAWIALTEQLEPYLRGQGNLPVDIIQSLFAAFQPLQALTKFSEFTDLDPDSPEARRFVLVEDWLNDGVPLTAPVVRDCFYGWYGKNDTANFRWRVDGQVIDPRAMHMPAYLIVPGKDRIVPPESALPLAKLLPHVALHEPMSGHIGLMASKNASRHIWAPLIHWLKEH